MTDRVKPLQQCTIAAAFAFKLIEIAESAGVPPERLSKIDLPPRGTHAIETRIPYERQLELWEAIMSALDDPGFPITVGSLLRPSDYSVVGFACMTSANLRQAMEHVVRYARIWTNAIRWEVREEGGAVTLSFVAPEPHRLGMRCITESVLCEMINAARVLSGTDFAAREVRFRHAKPKDTRVHEAFFRSPISFDAPRSEIVFDQVLLDAPLLKADPELAAYFQRHTEVLLERCARDETLAERLEAELVKEIPRGLPTLDLAASRLGMSSRTLRRRRLSEEGTRFQDVLDRARCALAKRYLDEPKLALGEVAFLLGFSEPSAFHRAFKRWTGATPLSHRRGALSA